jgi:hypothetical protein
LEIPASSHQVVDCLDSGRLLWLLLQNASLREQFGSWAYSRAAQSLWAVHTETPNFLANNLNGTSACVRCRLRSAISLRVNLRNGGRPKVLPFALAFAKPDFTRSAISDLSNWATAPIIWNSISPAGSEVSTASVTDTKSMPSALHSSRPAIKFLRERAKRSNFQTMTTSTDRRRQSLSSSSSPGRLAVAPVHLSR